MLKSNLYFTPMFATCESKESKEIPEEALRNLHQGDHHGDHESDQGDNNGAHLIFVTTATTGGGVLFSSRRTFLNRERGRNTRF